MTYKSIVKHMVEQDARTWFEKVLIENGFNDTLVFIESSDFEQEKDTIYWSVKVDAHFKSTMRHFEIGGTVDDLCGICCSVIWDHNHQVVWMNVKETRETLGIKELKIA